jgi:ABC-2 type transport system permease protein
MEQDLSEAVERLKVRDMATLDYEAYLALKTDIRVVGLDYATGEIQDDGKAVIGFLFSLLMFMFVMIYGMHVMRGVIEEKANRIVEVILSTVRPMHLLSAKIVGIGAVGLTQMLAWSMLGWLFTLLFGWGLEQSEWLGSWASNNGLAEQSVDLETVLAHQEGLAFLLDIHWPTMVGCGLVYFLLGFALYAAFFAAIGSMVEQESDAQYLLLPVMLPLIFSYMLAAQAIEAPESTLAVVSSFVPFSAPISMMVRLPIGVPWWQVGLSVSLLFATTLLVLALAGRVYRVAILMYGKKLGLLEMVRWMFRSNSSAL